MVRVLHSYPLWLSQTMAWLHRQIGHLPPEVRSHVVCERTANLDQFHLPNVHVTSVDAPVASLRKRILRRLGLARHDRLLARYVERLDAHVVHSHFGHIGWEDLGSVIASGRPHVVTFYGVDVNRIPVQDPKWRGRYEALFEHVRLVLAEGPHMAGEIERLGCPPAKVRVHRLGVDVEGIEFRPRTWRPGRPLRILMAGTFREKKGFPYALEALARLDDSIEWTATIVGDATSAPRDRAEKERIVGVIRREELGERVRLAGFLTHDELMETAARHHLFLVPSVHAEDGDTEGGAPVVMMEMMASGMPIVATRHCDIPNVVEDGISGLLAPERDVETLRRQVESLAESAAAWPELTRAGRARIEKRFDVRRQSRILGEIYRELTVA